MKRIMCLWVLPAMLCLCGAAYADPPSDSCDVMFPGDANNNGEIEVGDINFLGSYVCANGPAPNPAANGDVDGDCDVDQDDIDYLVAYVFQSGPAPVECTCWEPVLGLCADSCTFQFPGDANTNGEIEVGDINFLGSYVCTNGPAPNPAANGDVDGDCDVDQDDIDYLVAYVFQSGPAPVDCTCKNPVKGNCADTCDFQYPGDANSDDQINVADVRYLAAFLCLAGPAPSPMSNGDANGDCLVDSLDITYLNKYIFEFGPVPVSCTCSEPVRGECYSDYCGFPTAGNANDDNNLNVGDAIYIINRVFRGGPAPEPWPVYSGDANCDCEVNIGDAVFIVNWVFKDGPRPCTCDEWEAFCGSPLH